MHRAWLLAAVVAAVLACRPSLSVGQEHTPVAGEASPVSPLDLLNPMPPAPTPVVFDVLPGPEECTVAPRPVEDFVIPEGVAPSEGRRVQSEAELPKGPPADAATVAAIEALERELAACYNAGDLRRWAALITDEELRRGLAAYGLEHSGPEGAAALAEDFLATPVPLDPLDQVPVLVRDVRVLPDGRVGAVVDWCVQIMFVVHEQVEERWLAAEDIEIERRSVSCDWPMPPGLHGTPVP